MKTFFRHGFQILAILIGSYIVCEIIFSTLYVNGWIVPVEPFWVTEESGKTVHFDPVLGYRLTQISSRVAKISNGEVEFSAILKGNAQGFADVDDFIVQGKDPKRRRIAVLGDSFTAAQYLEKDWTQRIESYAQQSGQPVEMLNFALAGGGLANWWSTITKYIKTEGYVLDGIIFAVFEDNLHRGFSVADHRNQRQHPFGRVPSWNPEEWPQTLEQAQTYMQLLRGFILSQQEFEQALHGDWQPPDPPLPWQPYAAIQIKNTLKPFFLPADQSAIAYQVPPLTSQQLKLIDGIAAYIQEQSLPVIVASIPSRSSLLADAPTPDDVKQFAQRLGAVFVEGKQAFAGLSKQEIRAHWLPVDGHWGQLGSDAFARLVWKTMQDWKF